jgi:phosphatidylglycerophosphate synthase
MTLRDNRLRRNGTDTQSGGEEGLSGPGRRFLQIAYFDQWFVRTALSACIRKCCDWHIHPNAITVVALVITAAILFLHHFRLFWEVAAAIVLRQVLDCIDGEVARRCHKISRLGAWLDSISDSIFYFSLISIVVSFFTPYPLRTVLFSVLVFGVWFAIHVAICKEAALIGHSIRDYNTPSLYRRSYAFMVNNSLIFVVVIVALYRLAVR